MASRMGRKGFAVVIVRCDRCEAHDATWTVEGPLFGYHSLCDGCHTCVKHLLESINAYARALPERDAVLSLGFVVKQNQLKNQGT